MVDHPNKEKCQICSHDDRKDIEGALFDGGPGNSLREISKKYSIVAGKLLYHKENHMVDCAKELVKMVSDEYDRQLKKTGVQKAMTSVEVLDLVIARAPDLIRSATMNDVLRAIKLKAELLGTITQKQTVELSWLNDIPDKEEKKE